MISPLDYSDLIAHMSRALQVKPGLALKCSEPEILRDFLNRARKQEGTGQFDVLTFCVPPIPQELWIVHRASIPKKKLAIDLDSLVSDPLPKNNT